MACLYVRRVPILMVASFSALASGLACAAEATPLAVKIDVDVAQSTGPLPAIWRFFGADEPNYATMKDGRKLLGELGALAPDHVYFRAHNLLTSGDGTPALKWGSTDVYHEDAQGRPTYSWTILDRIFDTYRARRIRPYVEIGFMPEPLSRAPAHYATEWHPGLDFKDLGIGWTQPPKDYDKWRELVYQWARHCVERYGAAEVEQWYWETWNEANIPYWSGTEEEFFKLHDYAIDGVRRALPTARVGGYDAAGDGGKFTADWLRHITQGTNYATGKIGTPTDFLSFHSKGKPEFVDNHLRLGISNHLQTVDRAFGIIAGFPELANRPIIIGESDPDSCAACLGPQFGYRRSTLYSSYTAAVIPRLLGLAHRHGLHLDGAVTWAFEFEDQPYFVGFRSLSSNGLPLPVLNVFRLFSRMSGDQIAVASSGERPLEEITAQGVRGPNPDVSAVAARDGKKITVLVWYYFDDDVPLPDAAIDLQIRGLPVESSNAHVTQYRIDGEHSNAYTAWQRMGSPVAPNNSQYAELERAGELATMGPAGTVAVASGTTTLHVDLPRSGVALFVVEP
ncbi:MAG TPA: beta-xylosidase [Candidatus Didemnitutus sp.]|nr:beta-xylosidase [Candidatus Didemnitutus sp.]